MLPLDEIWTKLGVPSLKSPFKRSIDLEKTLIATSQQGRARPRLLWGMRAWLLKHHDLVSGYRLARLVKQEKQTAVLGAILDSVVEEQPRSYLKYLLSYCQPAARLEFVFPKDGFSKKQLQNYQRENLPVWERWNLIGEGFKDQIVIQEKAFVLKHNLNLALRALLGASARADILSYLLEHQDEEKNARQIAQAIDYSYEPVHSELRGLLAMGIIEYRKMQTLNSNLYRFNKNMNSNFLIDLVIALGNNQRNSKRVRETCPSELR